MSSEAIPERAAARLERSLVELVHCHRLDELSDELKSLTQDDAPRRPMLRHLLAELATTLAQLIRARIGPLAPDEVLTIQARSDTGERITVDELDPSIRAMLRAVLALVDGRFDDAATQIGFAADDPEPLGRVDAVLEALLWIDALLDVDGDHIPVSAWPSHRQTQ